MGRTDIPDLHVHVRYTAVEQIATLIGINAYPGCPLEWCLKDIHDMADRLFARGWNPDQLRILLDHAATTDAIWDALWEAAHKLKPGDKWLIHYSGHGATYCGVDAYDQPDHINNVLVPYDFDWSPQHMITDSQLANLWRMLPRGVRLNFYADCCHSGHLDRELSPRKPRHYPAPPHIVERIARAKAKGMRRDLPPPFPGGFISGCQSNQTSADAGELQNGAFTHYLLAELANNEGRPLTEVCAAVHADLEANGYEQNPQCDGEQAGLPWVG